MAFNEWVSNIKMKSYCSNDTRVTAVTRNCKPLKENTDRCYAQHILQYKNMSLK